MISRIVIRALCVTLLVSCGKRGAAQERQYSGAVGPNLSTLRLVDDSASRTTTVGVGAWGTFKLSPAVAVEGRLTWFPEDAAAVIEAQGGQTLMLAAGVRATLFQSPSVAVTGVLEPGLIRFSRTLRERPGGVPDPGASQHLMLDMGFGLQLLPNARWTPRIDVLRTLYVVPGAVIGPEGTDGFTVRSIGEVTETYRVNVGVGYQFRRRATSPERGPRTRLTIGPHVGYSTAVGLLDSSVRRDAAWGGFASLAVHQRIALDGAVTLDFSGSHLRTPWEGGRRWQALAGLKTGVEHGRVGAFVKARAGIVGYSSTVVARDDATDSFTFERNTLPALDVGGIIEIGVQPSLALRLEAGALSTFYRDRVIRLGDEDLVQPGSPARHTLQMFIGLGWKR